MVLPEADDAAQQIRPPQKRAVFRNARTDDHVIAAAGARVLAVDHELLGAEPALVRQFVKISSIADQFVP